MMPKDPGKTGIPRGAEPFRATHLREEDIVEKRGSFYPYGETRVGQGRENTKGFLRENPDLALEIENKAQIRQRKVKRKRKNSCFDNIN